ncbi:hypothetical protein GCM10009646_22090 [Streptomyces aureus]
MHLRARRRTPVGLRKRGPDRIREGVRVVGTYVHAYDPPRRPQYPTPIPAMRGTHESVGGRSATPIYDALYSEYRRSFRALPGDRSGEENLSFSAFGSGSYTVHHSSSGRHGASYHEPQHVHSSPPTGSWHANGRQHSSGSNLPAALPPAPRRER